MRKGFGIMKLKELKEKGILIEKLEEIVKAEREEWNYYDKNYWRYIWANDGI